MATLYDMMENVTLSCPSGGDFYVCDTSWTQFTGCCTVNPCKFGYGDCPKHHMRPISFNAHEHKSISYGLLSCLSSDKEMRFYFCANLQIPFLGCCRDVPCVEEYGCLDEQFGAAVLGSREAWPMTAGSDEAAGSEQRGLWVAESGGKGLLGFAPILGISLSILLIAVSFLIFLAWKKWHPSSSRKVINELIYNPQVNVESTSTMSRDSQKRYRQVAEPSWSLGVSTTTEFLPTPQSLHQKNAAWATMWAWDIVLTLTPTLFLVLALLAVRLEGQAQSEYGERISELIQLSPTAYPIIFAAVASRFFKALARWQVEQRQGVKLGVIEQIFGSQSFAGSFERLLFVRSHLALGVLIFLIWVMSPLGGQSASRVLSLGESRTSNTGTVFYADPSYQFSRFYMSSLVDSTEANVQALYTLQLMSPAEQRRSPRDLWQFPRIPQWPRNRDSDREHEVDDDSLARGEEDYSSLLGIKLQGLDLGDETVGYDFSIQTSYIDLYCSSPNFVNPKDIFDRNDSVWNSVDVSSWVGKKGDSVIDQDLSTSFAVNITAQGPWSTENRSSADSTPKFRMAFASLQTELQKENEREVYNPVRLFAFNCTMSTVYLETDLHCPSPSSCRATRQRRLTPARQQQFPDMIQDHLGGFIAGSRRWERAAGSVDRSAASATENFIAGQEYLYGTQQRYDWRNIKDLGTFSRQLTTAFNTFLDATKGPLEYSNIDIKTRQLPGNNTVVYSSYDIHDFYNETQAVGRLNNVYRADRVWIAILLGTTMVLQLLAILGLVLLGLVKGPDVLGFVSSMTRDNPHIPLPEVGSGLDGPERARMLRDMRVQLVDVRPLDEIGYVAFMAMPLDKPESQAGEDVELESLAPQPGQQQDQDGDEAEASDRSMSLQPWRAMDLRKLYR